LWIYNPKPHPYHLSLPLPTCLPHLPHSRRAWLKVEMEYFHFQDRLKATRATLKKELEEVGACVRERMSGTSPA